MVVPMNLKHLFGLVALAWIFLWLAAAVTIGDFIGDSVRQIWIFLGMTFLPPVLLYLLPFRVLPQIIKWFKKPATI